MDSNEVKKRFVNDVAAPAATKSAPTLELNKRQTITVSDANTELEDTLLAPAEMPEAKDKPLLTPTAEKVIQPPKDMELAPPVEEHADVPTDAPEPVKVEAPTVDPLPEQAPAQPEQVAEAKPAEPEDKDVPVSEVYQASDALPDDTEKAANAIKDGMQEPKLYDTTAYHVPIKETHHGHGSTKAALVFGALCALIAVGGALYFMFVIGT